MIKVSKKVDEQFKQVVQIAIKRNPLEPFKWLQQANSVKGEWGEGLEELDTISTEQMMLMYTMGYEVVEENSVNRQLEKFYQNAVDKYNELENKGERWNSMGYHLGCANTIKMINEVFELNLDLKEFITGRLRIK